MDYSSYYICESGDGQYKFRVYPSTGEAAIMQVRNIDAPVYQMPSYVTVDNGIEIPVTSVERNAFVEKDSEYMKLNRNAVCTEGNFDKVKTLILPEQIKELDNIPIHSFINLEELQGEYKNVTRLKEETFYPDIEINRIDLSSVFPNLLEIEKYAFISGPGELILPKGLTYVAPDAFNCDSLTLTCRYEDNWDLPVCGFEELHLILPGENITTLPKLCYNSVYWNECSDLNKVYLESENKNIVFSGDNLGEMFAYPSVFELHLPDGMTRIRKNEFDSADPQANAERHIDYVILPDSVTEFEENAFETRDHIILEVLVPLNDKTDEEVEKLAEEITSKSKNLVFGGIPEWSNFGNKRYIEFYDPEFGH